MTTTYETENHKSGVMSIRGVKRIWVYDKNTGHFAKLKGRSPIYSKGNTEKDLINKLENKYGAEINVCINLKYNRPSRFSSNFVGEIKFEGKYWLFDNDFFTVKNLVEQYIRDNTDLEALADKLFNDSFENNGKNRINFDDVKANIELHNHIGYLDSESFSSIASIRGSRVNIELSSLTQEIKGIIKDVVRE